MSTFLSLLGNFSHEKFKKNIQSAIKVYRERVDGTRAMETEISLFPGIEDSMYHRRRENLLVFLSGSKTAKNQLKHRIPKLWKHFEKVWEVRRNHLVKTPIPHNLAFVLNCCGDETCPHPRCSGSEIIARWSPSGPAVKDVMPVPEIDVRPSNSSCIRCGKKCDGHYKTDPSPLSSVVAAPVPSLLIKEELEKNENLNDNDFSRIGRSCLVSPDVVKFYVEHLKTVKLNRKKGAVKAQKTRAAKKAAMGKK